LPIVCGKPRGTSRDPEGRAEAALMKLDQAIDETRFYHEAESRLPEPAPVQLAGTPHLW